ncbi:hypothetical protein ACIBQ1_37010 [Nonomuraea sp. NPDC050153]|uniref:hypothetical protein n=1 Tax=Nonomuraea sp. NPDC050153 TaxID=3364359 RepID=UPI0037B2817E
MMESRYVDREYLDEELHRLATDPAFRPRGWTAREVADFRVLVQCARAASLDTDLRNCRMLRIQPGDTRDPHKARATLSSGRAINLTFKNAESHGAVVFELLAPEMETSR